MGVAFPDPMQMPQLVLQREGKKSVIYGYSPQGPHSRFIQFTTGKGKLLGYMKGSLEGMGMKMGDKNTLRVYSAEKEYLGAISGGMTRSHGVVDPSGKWIMALQGRQGGVLRTMKFHYSIIVPHKKKFFRKLSGKPDPEERVGYVHGQRGQAMFGISVMGLPSIQPGAFASFDGEFTLDLDKSVNILLAIALFFRQNAIFEFQEVMPGH